MYHSFEPPVVPLSPRTFSFCNFHRLEMPDVVRRNSNFKDTAVLLTGPRLGSGVKGNDSAK